MNVMRAFLFLLISVFSPTHVFAAPYAAISIDAVSGEVLHCENCDTRLHPAGLTKLLTLYIAFQAIESGLVTLDDEVVISKNVAGTERTALELKEGSTLKLRYLIRAAAVMGANDASNAIAEHVAGSEALFARLMNKTSKDLGMSRSTWKNAHGLTEKGHLSTARDMAIISLALKRHFPDYYNLFSRIRTNAGVREVAHSGRRYLGNMRGASFFKHGYTRAAGFNGSAITERGSEIVLTVVFGGRSSATRNKMIANISDQSFRLIKSSEWQVLSKQPDPYRKTIQTD